MEVIENHTGYFIDDDGEVYCNLGRGNRRNGKTVEPYVVKPRPTKKGYLRICARNDITGKRDDLYIHKLVGDAYLEKSEEDTEINHKHGNKADNRASELEWVTRSENIQHAIDTGLHPQKGEDNWMSVLTWEQVKNIREQYKPMDEKYSAAKLAKHYGVSPSTISNIVHGKTWIEDEYTPKLHRTKVSPEYFQEIKDKYIYKDPKYGAKALAKEYGVCQQTIGRIVRGEYD